MKHKSVCQLIFEYIDGVPVGDFVTRQDLIKYVKKHYITDCIWKYRDGSSYGSIDTYRRVFQVNNILSDSNGTGVYMKIRNIPKEITFNDLKKRGYKNPLFSKRGSFFEDWCEDV